MDSFQDHLALMVKNLFTENIFCDVTLVTDDQTQFKAHKFVLSACSSILKSLFEKNPHPHPLIYLNGVQKKEMEWILQFMYLGETRIDDDGIEDFFNVAEIFKVKQLAQETALSWF